MGLLDFLFGKMRPNVDKNDEAAEILSKVRKQLNKNSYLPIPDKLEPMIDTQVIEDPVKPQIMNVVKD